jgi:ribosome-binding protein aMBF1 (putative translation factor)
MAKDFVDEIIDERTRRNPRFPQLVAEAERRRALARQFADERHAKGLSQTVVAARMGTAASVVSKLEAGGDVKLSNLQSYCEAVGTRVSIGTSARASRPSRRATPVRKGA